MKSKENTSEEFLVYGINPNEKRDKPAKVECAEDAVGKAAKFMEQYYEVIITDMWDNAVFHAINGIIIFPKLNKEH